MKTEFLALSALTVALFSSPLVLSAQSTDDKTSNAHDNPQFHVTELPSEIKYTLETVDMDQRGDNNLAGAHFLFHPNSWVYTGFGGYAGVHGDLGGLFVLGADAGINHPIYHQLFFNAGYFAGGGGANNDDNNDHNGLMTRSHAGLSYHFGGMSIGAEYSRIYFPDYNTDANQIALTLSTSGNFLYGDHDYNGMSTARLSDIFSPSYLGFYKTFIGFTPQTYFIDDGDTMQLAGVEAGYFFTPGTYFSLSTSGAYDSSQDGYMDAFIGLGHESRLTNSLAGYWQANIGTGGGGGTDTGGGLMYKPMVGLNYYLTPSLSIRAAGGYLINSSSDFDGTVANLGIVYNFLNAVPGDLVPEDYGIDIYRFTGWRLTVGSQTYIAPQRERNSLDEENIGLATITIDRMLNQRFFVTGQAASAYHGNAGSYASGMVGLGAQSPSWKRASLMTDILVGAAGGASMDVGRGAIYQPEVGVNVNITHNLGLQAKVGQVKSFDGELDATTWNLGVSFDFTMLSEDLG